MKRLLPICMALAAMAPWPGAWGGIIDFHLDAGTFASATGAVSLTGALPDIGNQGTSVTLGDATLSAGNSIYVGTGWSTLLPNERAIAISGPENLNIAIDTGRATAFGFYFHEPGSSTGQQDGCNATCVDSLFRIDFLAGGSLIDTAHFNAADDQEVFLGLVLDQVFDTVRFTEVEGGIDNEFFGEMFVSRVPEPATLGLLGAGLLGLGLGRRRRA